MLTSRAGLDPFSVAHKLIKRGSMRKTTIRITIFTLSLLMLVSAQAADELEVLKNHLDSRRYAEAWAMAERLEPQRAGQPDFDFLYAQAALAAKRTSQAIFALERIRLRQPMQQQARLLLVAAYLDSGDPVRAGRELNALLASEPSAAIQREAQKFVAQLNSSPAFRPIRGFVALDIGYDSNLNSATDAASVTGIGGNPVLGTVLAPGDRAQEGSLARLSAGYGGKLALGPRVSLFTDVFGYAHALYDQTQFSTSLYQARLGASWQAGRHRLTLPLSRQVLSVDHRRYSIYDAATLEWAYTLTAAQRLMLTASRGLGTYVDQPTRDIHTTAASIGWRTTAGRWRLGVTAHYGVDSPRVDFYGAPVQSNAFMGRSITALGFDSRYRLWPRHELRFGLVYQGSHHDGTDPVFSVVRHDRYASALAAWDWELRPSWMLRAEVNQGANRSNIDLYDFDRTQVLLGVRHDFY